MNDRKRPFHDPPEWGGGVFHEPRRPHHHPFRHFPRPAWWPQDEPWPPEPPFGRRHRPPFRFRWGCLLSVVFLLSSAGCGSALLIALFRSVFPEELPRGVLLVPLVGFVLFAIILGGILSQIVSPLDEVMDAADRVAAGDYTTRLEEHGPPQMRTFTRSFNMMTGRLRAYDEQRKRLLADISHELRTPLTVLQGNLEGMLDNVYPRDEEHLALLLEETRILARLIEDLRTFSLAETGKLVLRKEPCDPARLVSDLAQAMQPSAGKAGVTLVQQTDPGLPNIEADIPRMREILENLATNAIRHTPEGGTVRIGCRRDAGGTPRLEFRVEDNGRGIPADLLPHVFDRYVKSVDSGGTGLGLAIAKQLVEAHGGEIRAESEEGEGTAIRFWMPA
ncbi:MAG: HAMP domain-containing histidine kinase [Anaerolineales bacterium]|nr:HAMP domain-containing histidine kinase [Anaerolineales bacterium]